jgi:aminoglycoside phosphotransferase (APT) family kinase protein
VLDVLRRHVLPQGKLEPPFVGTFPTFIVGDFVVKLFGTSFDGERSSQVEVAMLELLDSQPGIPAPSLVASGRLFDAHPFWPYLVTVRAAGRAIRDVELTGARAERVAADIGTIVGRLHEMTAPDNVADRDLLEGLRVEAPARLRRFGLPERLVEQVPDFLADAEPAAILVHGDITADHVFVDDQGVTALIDWGDALAADRAYELPAVYLDALRGDRRHFAAFLESAHWPQRDLARRGLQGILEFEFNAVARVAELVQLADIETLDSLAERLFAAPTPA